MATVKEYGEGLVLALDSDDPIIGSEDDAMGLIGTALGEGAMIIAVPIDRLAAEFFQLRSGLAGAIAQKMVNYRRALAIIGDITPHLAASAAFRDWVRETNRGDDVWFLQDNDDLDNRLGG